MSIRGPVRVPVRGHVNGPVKGPDRGLLPRHKIRKFGTNPQINPHVTTCFQLLLQPTIMRRRMFIISVQVLNISSDLGKFSSFIIIIAFN